MGLADQLCRRLVHPGPAAVRPIDPQSVTLLAAEELIHRYIEGFAFDVQERVLERRDRLRIDPARGLPRRRIEPRERRVVGKRIGTFHERRELFDHFGSAPTAVAFVVLAVTHDPFVGGDLAVGEDAPAGVRMEGIDLGDFHGVRFKVDDAYETTEKRKSAI